MRSQYGASIKPMVIVPVPADEQGAFATRVKVAEHWLGHRSTQIIVVDHHHGIAKVMTALVQLDRVTCLEETLGQTLNLPLLNIPVKEPTLAFPHKAYT